MPSGRPSATSPDASLGRNRASARSLPNLLICGTPGTGKSSLAAKLVDTDKHGLQLFDLSKYAVDHNLVDGWDEVLNCAILDEDKVMSHITARLREGGCVLDYHSGDFIDEHLIDLVVVLRTDNTLLYDRLKARGYPEAKISNNLECEIFQTILDEAREVFEEEKVLELTNDTVEQQADNLQRLIDWIDEWTCVAGAQHS